MRSGTTHQPEAVARMEKRDQVVESTNETDETVVMAEMIAPSGRLVEAAESAREKAKSTMSTERGGLWRMPSKAGLEKIETLAGRPETAARGMQQQCRVAAESRGIGAKEESGTEAGTKGVAIEQTEGTRETEHSVRMSSGGSIGMTEDARGEEKKPMGRCRATAKSEHGGNPESLEAMKKTIWMHSHDWLAKD